jgi:steroid delta-isomerase-like uncharacterized protein
MVKRFFLGVVVIIVGSVLHLGCLCGPCEEAAKNKEIVLATFEAINNGELEKLDELVAADYVRHCPATPEVNVTNLEEFKQYLRDVSATFPDLKMSITHLIAEDRLVAYWATYSGTQEGPMGPFPATGKRVESHFAGMHRLEHGKIAESWLTWDNLNDLAQLGHYPPKPPEESLITE